MDNGLAIELIDRQFNIAPEMVKSHAKNILWKLLAQTRVS